MNYTQTIIHSDGATIGHNGKLGTVSEVGLGVFIPSLNCGMCKRVPGISNNEAEFKALLWAMEIAEKNGIKNPLFLMDSEIVVNRANGKRPRKKYYNERMDNFQKEVLSLRDRFESTEFRWIPREENYKADWYSKNA